MAPDLSPLSIHFPGKLVFGPGTLASLADELLQVNASRTAAHKKSQLTCVKQVSWPIS